MQEAPHLRNWGEAALTPMVLLLPRQKNPKIHRKMAKGYRVTQSPGGLQQIMTKAVVLVKNVHLYLFMHKFHGDLQELG